PPNQHPAPAGDCASPSPYLLLTDHNESDDEATGPPGVALEWAAAVGHCLKNRRRSSAPETASAHDCWCPPRGPRSAATPRAGRGSAAWHRAAPYCSTDAPRGHAH